VPQLLLVINFIPNDNYRHISEIVKGYLYNTHRSFVKMFEFLAKAEGNQDKLKPLDLFFDVVKDEIALTASVSVANSMRNTTAPFVYPFYVVSKIVRDGEIDYPTDIEYFGSERTSSTVRENAVALVKWNSKSIIDAIKRYG